MLSFIKRSSTLNDFVIPLQRLAYNHNEGVPLDKDFYKSYYFCFESSQIKMVFDGDYVIKVRGYYEGEWYSRWTEVFRDFRQPLSIKEFFYTVNKVCYGQEVRHGLWSYL